jgi:precorrin-2 dehydrogenase/sirohydrochlorin ferrochelatase
MGATGHRPPTYPINLELDGVPCLVVGGGPIAARKVAGLLACGAAVTVVSPDAVAAIGDDSRVRWHERQYQRGEVASYRVAIAATGVREVDQQVSRDARAVGIPVNVADVPELCTFTLPSIVRRGDLQVTVSTNGKSPAFSGWVRDRIEAELQPHLLDALNLLAETRVALRATGRSSEHHGWYLALEKGLVDLVREGRTAEARALLRQALDFATTDDGHPGPDAIGDSVVPGSVVPGSVVEAAS